MEATDTYLQLLRAACFGNSFEGTVSPGEVQEILRLCQIHGTGPLVYNELLKGLTPRTPSPDGEEELLIPELKMHATAMKQVCMQNMLLQGQWEQIIVKVWKSLSPDLSPKGERSLHKDETQGVHAVLMKGFAYAHNYPLPYLRSWGDLDVWVGPEQYHKACGLLREAFPEAKHHDEEWDELKHYCFVFPDGKAIELHRVSMDFLSARDQQYWCQLEAEAANGGSLEVAGVQVPVFEPKFDLLFCFMHSWEHFTGSGIPLKQVCDMALLVHFVYRPLTLIDRDADRSSATDRPSRALIDEYLRKHLTALAMMEVWKAYGYMACKAMGMDWAEWPLLCSSLEDGADSAYSLEFRGVEKETVKYGERLYEQVIREGQCRKKDYGEATDRYEARENARKMNILARKWLTLRGRIEKARFMHYFAPRYARYVLWQEIKKGIRRTLRREEMINY